MAAASWKAEHTISTRYHASKGHDKKSPVTVMIDLIASAWGGGAADVAGENAEEEKLPLALPVPYTLASESCLVSVPQTLTVPPLR